MESVKKLGEGAKRYVKKRLRGIKKGFLEAFWEYPPRCEFIPPSYVLPSYMRGAMAICVAVLFVIVMALLYYGYMKAAIGVTLASCVISWLFVADYMRPRLEIAAVILSNVSHVTSWAMLGDTAIAMLSSGTILVIRLKSIWRRPALSILYPQYLVKSRKGRMVTKVYSIYERSSRQVYERSKPSWSAMKISELEEHEEVAKITTLYGRLRCASPLERWMLIEGLGRATELTLSEEPEDVKSWSSLINVALRI